ncbi:MAG: histone deacetylase [Deltaproteobacteria bacterium]|nr:histone deacetylase [Deltaproteobacteria bacterium]
MNKIALVQDPLYLEHLTGALHPESPQRLKAISAMLKNSGLESKTKKLEPRRATPEEIQLIHTPQLFKQIEATQYRESTYLDADTHASEKSFLAAESAVGGLLTALDELLEGNIEQAFCFPRPPGHHAEAHRAMGFCLFNNVAIAAEYALKKKNLKKVFIYDFDVHHGNGTQHVFEDRADVFYLSLHQYPFYPGTGAASEKGQGAGEGYTLNLPLPAGCGDKEYLQNIQNQVEPALLNYKPDLLIVSAGFDAHQRDPLGGMEVSTKGFRAMAESITKMKIKCGNIPVLYSLEGGYDLQGLSESVKEVVEVMLQK